MEIKKIDYDFSVCKMEDYSLVDLDAGFHKHNSDSFAFILQLIIIKGVN